MKKNKVFILMMTLGIFFLSCQKNEVHEDVVHQMVQEPTKEQLQKLFDMGVNNKNVTIEEVTLLDRSKERFFVAGDILIPFNELESFHASKNNKNRNKQYRTRNIVSPENRIINIVGYTGPGNALTARMRTALQWAVNNYNRLNTSLEFRLIFSPNYQSADMVVYSNNISSVGGAAGFPYSSGKPYKWVQINAGTDAWGTNVVEHVITHEIGHCIGFAHQDWFDLQSCGNVSPPPVTNPPIWIPGTPINTTEDSVMLACFDETEDGELSDSDILALEILYSN